MSDMTLLYYTANVIPEGFAISVRNHLVEASKGKPIVSVSQKPLDFGDNLCVGDIGRSVLNVYIQILEGAKRVKTRYLACCEDDTLYVPEHFDYEPPDETFSYNVNYWRNHKNVFYYVERRGMCVCVAPAELMVKTLETRLEAFNNNTEGCNFSKYFGEPGRFERHLGLPLVGIESFRTEISLVTFRHRWSLSGSEGPGRRYQHVEDLPYWGKASDLWGRFYA